MASLKISETLSLPLEAVTSTFCILAIRGVGKTHTASVMAEEMLKNRQPICVYDPTGAWWGLKTSADGQHPGFSVVIFGGEHADVPLEEESGALIARVIVEKRIPAILDVNLLRKGARIRFMTAFCEELYHRNREPLHLFLDEAHTVAPQNLKAMPELARLVGALEDIMLQGRRKGLGITAISQRPAILNTTIRTMCETLICMRIIGPHDRKAILEWVEAHSTQAESKTMLDSLATLKKGQGWVWSPALLNVFKLVQFRQRETFDSSATPEVGKKSVTPQAFAAVDLKTLGEQIQATVEKAKADDPKELKRRIAELEKQIATQPIGSGVIARLTKERDDALASSEQARQLGHSFQSRFAGMVAAIDAFFETQAEARVLPLAVPLPVNREPLPAARIPSVARVVQAPPPAAQREGLTGPQTRILAALSKGLSIGKESLNRTWTGFLAGASPKSSSFINNLSALRTKGLLDYRPGGLLCLTPAGVDASGGVAEPMSETGLHSAILGMLTGPQQRILDALLKIRGKSVQRSDLADAAGASSTSSSFINNLSALRSLGVLDYESGGYVHADSNLFLGGHR